MALPNWRGKQQYSVRRLRKIGIRQMQAGLRLEHNYCLIDMSRAISCMILSWFAYQVLLSVVGDMKPDVH